MSTREDAPVGPVTVIRAWLQRGWSRRDHELDDTLVAHAVGRTYASREAMRRSLERGGVGQRYYPAAEIVDSAGVRWIDATAQENGNKIVTRARRAS